MKRTTILFATITVFAVTLLLPTAHAQGKVDLSGKGILSAKGTGSLVLSGFGWFTATGEGSVLLPQGGTYKLPGRAAQVVAPRTAVLIAGKGTINFRPGGGTAHVNATKHSTIIGGGRGIVTMKGTGTFTAN